MAAKTADEVDLILAAAGNGHKRNSEASIIPFEDGRLLAAWSDFYGEDSADEGPSRISARWSKGEGRTWDAPFTLQENIGSLNCMSASMLRLASGRVLLVFGRKDGQPSLNGSAAILHAMVKWSDDDCKTWSQPKDLTRGDDYWCMTNDRLVQLSSGRILYPVTSHTAGNHVWYSDDNGATWDISQQNIAQRPDINYAEPTVVELKGGRVAMYIRSRAGNLHVALSDDGGISWREHKMHRTDMAGHPDCGPNSAEAPCMVKRVPSTGDLLLVWNNNRVRTPLSAALSSDDGETWHHIRDIEPMQDWPPRIIHTYPSLTFSKGNVHLTYGHVHLDWSKVNGKHKLDVTASLKYRRLAVEWFY